MTEEGGREGERTGDRRGSEGGRERGERERERGRERERESKSHSCSVSVKKAGGTPCHIRKSICSQHTQTVDGVAGHLVVLFTSTVLQEYLVQVEQEARVTSNSFHHLREWR